MHEKEMDVLNLRKEMNSLIEEAADRESDLKANLKDSERMVKKSFRMISKNLKEYRRTIDNHPIKRKKVKKECTSTWICPLSQNERSTKK